MKELFEWLAKNIFQCFGGFFVAMGMPLGATCFNRVLDFAVFLPIGVLFLSVSYYYTFVKK